MPTQAEITLLQLLSAIEVEPQSVAKAIEGLGNEGVTVLCDVALGTFPGLRPKVRTNAVALLGYVDHPQAKETVHLLVKDPDPDVGIRALRAAGRRKEASLVPELAKMLQAASLSPLVAAEVVGALQAIDSPEAHSALADYGQADPGKVPHRAAPVVNTYLGTHLGARPKP